MTELEAEAEAAAAAAAGRAAVVAVAVHSVSEVHWGAAVEVCRRMAQGLLAFSDRPENQSAALLSGLD